MPALLIQTSMEPKAASAAAVAVRIVSGRVMSRARMRSLSAGPVTASGFGVRLLDRLVRNRFEG